ILNHLERISLMSGREPGNLHIKLSFIQRQRAFHNARRDWPGDTATMLATLYHGGDYIFGIIKRSETGKPGNCIFMASIRRLSRSGLKLCRQSAGSNRFRHLPPPHMPSPTGAAKRACNPVRLKRSPFELATISLADDEFASIPALANCLSVRPINECRTLRPDP